MRRQLLSWEINLCSIGISTALVLASAFGAVLAATHHSASFFWALLSLFLLSNVAAASAIRPKEDCMVAPNERSTFRVVDHIIRRLLRVLPPTNSTEKVALRWGYNFRPRPRQLKLRSGLSFNFETVDFIPIILNYIGVFEPHLVKLIRKLLKPGDTVLDVGANIGFLTLEAWHRVGLKGRVVSIEASPIHTASILRNLELNGFPQVDVLNVAVGDRDGEATLGLPVGGNLGMFGLNAGEDSSFTVPLRRIDDLLADIPRLELIKMDIEGSELAALRGSIETLKRLRPAILIELNDSALRRCGASSTEVVEFLSALGYEGSVITRRGLRKINPRDLHECDECLFTYK